MDLEKMLAEHDAWKTTHPILAARRWVSIRYWRGMESLRRKIGLHVPNSGPSFDPKRKPSYPLSFRFDWCEMCGWHIECPRCGNNCCNASHGCEARWKDCTYCPLAYEFQEMCSRSGIYPKAKDEVGAYNDMIAQGALSSKREP